MQRKLFDLIRRFQHDERGAFAMIFAVMAISLIALSGAAVDFTTLQQARTRAQTALDAAALALQPNISTWTSTAIQTSAQSLLLAQLGDAVTTWKSCAATSNKPPCATVATPAVDINNGQLTLTANMKVPMYFVSLVGVTSLPAQIVSVATRKKLSLEVALVLDNSGSMSTAFGSGTRMTTLQASAKCAANILFYSGVTTCSQSTTGHTLETNVKMALVPFNDEVNVGTANATAAWLDRTGGTGTFDNDNFDLTLASNGKTDYTTSSWGTALDRINLFTQFGDSWKGCVEARVNDGASQQYDTDDTTPDPSNSATMFVPLFAPDEPDGSSSTYNNSYLSDTPAICNKTGTCSTSASATATYTATTTIIVDSGTETVKKGTKTQSSKNITTTTTTGPVAGAVTVGSTSSSSATLTTAEGWTRNSSGVCSCSGAGSTTYGTFQTSGNVSKGNPTSYSTLLPDVVQSNTPVSGETTTDHYTSATKELDTQKMTAPATTTNSCSYDYAPWVQGTASTSTGSGLTLRQMQERICKYMGTSENGKGYGPNGDCPASAIQPLTNTPGTLTTAITSMVAGGNTNIQEGAAWGFRVLSPTAPFTEGGAYESTTSKVMVIMTDGENTYNSKNNMNGASLYAAYAYPWDNYKGTSTARGRMGPQTLTTWADADYASAINTRLATTCTNAKNAGIVIYTIGLATNATSNPTANTALLTNCASAPGDAYFPLSATDLQNAFVAIAGQLAALRIAQ